jgi:hypothetical protein
MKRTSLVYRIQKLRISRPARFQQNGAGKGDAFQG